MKPYECVGAQLNQVFMNLLVNAAHAIETFGKITFAYQGDDWLWVKCTTPAKARARKPKPRYSTHSLPPNPSAKGRDLACHCPITSSRSTKVESKSIPRRARGANSGYICRPRLHATRLPQNHEPADSNTPANKCLSQGRRPRRTPMMTFTVTI